MPDSKTKAARNLIADGDQLIEKNFSSSLRNKFEIYSYRNAATILSGSFPEQFAEILSILENFQITESMIRTPGGSKGPIANYVDTLFSNEWRETRISADLNVRLLDVKRSDNVVSDYVRNGYLDGHRIDFVNGKVALDLEWNSKDQTYDRDLYAFSAFYDAGAIDLGIILTRGTSLNTDYFRSLGNVLTKSGEQGKEAVFKKFGASTTWMGKLLYRLEAGRNGGCPILAIGIKPECVVKD